MATVRKFNAVSPRPKFGGGVWWHNVGSAIENEKGQLSVYLDSVPVPDPDKDNKIVIMLFEKKEDDAERPPRRTATVHDHPAKRSSTPQKRDMDDEIPF